MLRCQRSGAFPAWGSFRDGCGQFMGCSQVKVWVDFIKSGCSQWCNPDRKSSWKWLHIASTLYIVSSHDTEFCQSRLSHHSACRIRSSIISAYHNRAACADWWLHYILWSAPQVHGNHGDTAIFTAVHLIIHILGKLHVQALVLNSLRL